jgi:hypothetical protein
MPRPVTITYWTQPYPRTTEDAKRIAAELRGDDWPELPPGGTLSNAPELRDPLSSESIREARIALREKVVTRLCAGPEPEPEFKIKVNYVPVTISQSAWGLFAAEIDRADAEIRSLILGYYV